MPKPLNILIFIVRHALEIGSGAAIIWGCFVTIFGAFTGHTLAESAVLGTAALALALFLFYWLLKLIEWFALNTERYLSRKRVANLLEQLSAPGRQTIFGKEVVNIWYDNQPTNAILRRANKVIMYRELDSAVAIGKIRQVPPGNTDRCWDINDVVRYFKTLDNLRK